MLFGGEHAQKLAPVALIRARFAFSWLDLSQSRANETVKNGVAREPSAKATAVFAVFAAFLAFAAFVGGPTLLKGAN